MKKTALIIVDLQNDFVPGGSLPVAEGHKIVPLIAKLLDLPFDVKVATKDWHPKDHGSFASRHGKKPGDVVKLEGIEQILWPEHCVQGSEGSNFVPGWDATKLNNIFYKGIEKNIDSYSTFFDNKHLRSTGLGEFLKERNITDVYLAGLATDYCIKYSALDARHLGFNTNVILEACRGVNLKPHDSEAAIKEMQKAGVKLEAFQEVLETIKKSHK